MKNLYLVLVVLVTFSFSGFSQGENDNWVFGHVDAGVNFSSGSPIPIHSNIFQSISSEGVACISDASGNLLFVTGGSVVKNRNYSIMPNGCCLTSHSSSVQGVVIIPFPYNPNKYYIFSTYHAPQNNNIQFSGYSIVDMTADGNLGDVVSHNNPLAVDASGNTIWNISSGVGNGDWIENITAIKSGNKYWVLIAYGTNLLAYKVDYYGVETIPVISPLDAQVNRYSHIRVSPNQNFVAISERYHGEDFKGKFSLYYFNDVPGKIQGSAFFTLTERINSSAFSSSGDIIWLAKQSTQTGVNSEIWGYNVNDLLVNPYIQPIVLDTGTEYTPGLQRGPDGEIYVSIYHSDHLGKINNSNNLSTATFDSQYLQLYGECRFFFPQLVPPRPECIQNLTLTTPENADMTRVASNKITTTQDYTACGHDIILSAGNSVEMLPNTFLCADLNYVLVDIGGCGPSSNSKYEDTNGNHLNLPDFSKSKSEKDVDAPYETGHNLLEIGGSKNYLSQINIYPNPTSDLLYINFYKSISIKSVLLLDIMGRKTNVIISSDNSIDMSNLASGVYILKLETNQGTMTKKVIKK